jgi:predicted NACHT family NTPase
LPSLANLLQAGRMTLLLDALNEIPYPGTEPIQRWKDCLHTLAEEYPGNRVIFSCRSLDYSATLSTKERPVPQVRIESLSDDQIQDFIQRYCSEHADTLWANLKGTPQLDLVRSPYYLKLLVEQSQQGEVSNGRAALFTGFVRQALKR